MGVATILHGVVIVALLVAGLPGLPEAPPAVEIVPVDLVRLADTTTHPSAPVQAQVPQEKAKETEVKQSVRAVPVPTTPAPPSAPTHTAETSPPVVITAVKPVPKQTIPKPITVARADAKPATPRPPRKPAPADPLSAKLEMLARLRQPSAPVPPDPGQQEGSGLSNATAANTSDRGYDATYALKDFIRAQVERRWNVDRAAFGSTNWTVSIRILIDPNGQVTRAEIIDDPRYGTNEGYRDFALSARNAVLLSSPLVIPPGGYNLAKDIVVDFDAKLLSR